MQQISVIAPPAVQVLDRLSAEAFARTGASAAVPRARDLPSAEIISTFESLLARPKRLTRETYLLALGQAARGRP